MEDIIVKVPATSANLACGFDSFGCAFSLYDEFEFEKGEGVCRIIDLNPDYSNERNLSYRAFMQTLEILGKNVPLKRLEAKKSDIPFARGLGSSSALIVSGVVAAAVLSGTDLSDTEKVEIATKIEGHPDNVAPCILGGFTASSMDENGIMTARQTVHPSLGFVLVIPPFKLSTAKARGVLPATVPFSDAVYNLSRTPILAEGLATGDVAKIKFAMRDKLHQPYRKKLIPGFDAIENICLSCGAVSFCISGAGPTMLAVIDCDENFEKIKAEMASSFPDFTVKKLSPDNTGATFEVVR